MDEDDQAFRELEAQGYLICRDAASIFIHCLTGWGADDTVIRDPKGRITTYINKGVADRDPAINDGFRYPDHNI